MRWWVLHVGRLHENKQEELQKRCCCRDRISNFGEFTWIYVFVLIATWHPVISCGHMLATKNTIKMTPASGARSHFCSNCKTVQMQVTIFHQRSAEHVFCSFFYWLRSPFLASVSVILQWKAAVSACILEARLEEERRRLAEEVGQGSGCGLVTDCQWPLQIGPK